MLAAMHGTRARGTSTLRAVAAGLIFLGASGVVIGACAGGGSSPKPPRTDPNAFDATTRDGAIDAPDALSFAIDSAAPANDGASIGDGASDAEALIDDEPGNLVHETRESLLQLFERTDPF